MTTPTPTTRAEDDLVTAEQAASLLDNIAKIERDVDDFDGDRRGHWHALSEAEERLQNAAPGLARAVIALHEALAAECARADAEKKSSLMWINEALEALDRADAAEARVAVLAGLVRRAQEAMPVNYINWHHQAHTALDPGK